MKTILYSVCVLANDNKILLTNRTKADYQGFSAPGGKVENNESPSDAAIREVKEETGYDVIELKFKGIAEYVDMINSVRHVVFNYISTEYEGTLIDEGMEGTNRWICLNAIEEVGMQKSFKERLKYILSDGTFEIHTIRTENNKEEEYIRML